MYPDQLEDTASTWDPDAWAVRPGGSSRGAECGWTPATGVAGPHADTAAAEVDAGTRTAAPAVATRVIEPKRTATTRAGTAVNRP